MENHLIQYDDEGLRSTVRCPEHRPPLFTYLKKWGIGFVGMPAPEGAKCDVCLDDVDEFDSRAKADAWDEGFAKCSAWWHACARGESTSVHAVNPYRAGGAEGR